MLKRLILLLSLVLGWPYFSAAGLVESREELERIRNLIDQAEKNLQQQQRSELNISRELAVLEKSLERFERQLRDLTGEQKALQQRIQEQAAEIDHIEAQTTEIVKRLEKRLVALYKEGDVGLLKVMFSADSPADMIQQYDFLTRVAGRDKELLREYRQIHDLKKNRLGEMEILQEQKRRLLGQQQQQRQLALAAQTLQARLLKQARQNQDRLSRELEELQANALELEHLISRLQAQEQEQQKTAADLADLGQGKLSWPVDGPVLIGFGTQKDRQLGTYFESNGIEIGASPGAPIRAVAAGKVVFADYFKGYGNLYILSHQGGYHTLYAQTDRMRKKYGDMVNGGDILGYSGLAGRQSIYFEIRSQGSPVNPLSWLIKR